MRRVATKIFLTFAVALAAFGLVAALAVVRLQDLGRDLKLLTTGYFPLGRIATQLEVKDWVGSRALEVRDLAPAARRAYLPVVRAHFPALVREKLEEGRRVARAAAALGGEEDARVLAEVTARLDALGTRWQQYDTAANTLLDLLEQGGVPEALEAQAQETRQLEKALTLDVKLLQAQLESRIADQVRATAKTESRTVVLILLYSAIALMVGVGAALFARRLLAPIERLTEGVKAVAAGDLTRQVEVAGNDEIALLAREFNAMAASLLSTSASSAAPSGWRRWGGSPPRSPTRCATRSTPSGSTPSCWTRSWRRSRAAHRRPARSRRHRQGGRSAHRHHRGVSTLCPGRARPDRRQDPAELLGILLDFLRPELAAARSRCGASSRPASRLRGDEAQLRQALLNLVRNASEAMADGGTLTVAARRAGDFVELEVSDTGGGIAPEALSRLFDPFYSTKERGTGLGLAFVQEVVQEHGGTVHAGGVPGRGATFTIRLPAAPEERPATPPPAAPVAPGAVATPAAARPPRAVIS